MLIKIISNLKLSYSNINFHTFLVSCKLYCRRIVKNHSAAIFFFRLGRDRLVMGKFLLCCLTLQRYYRKWKCIIYAILVNIYIYIYIYIAKYIKICIYVITNKTFLKNSIYKTIPIFQITSCVWWIFINYDIFIIIYSNFIKPSFMTNT